MLLRGKGLELEQVCEAWHNAQSVQREKEESHVRSLRERDTLISQLQTSLHTRTKEAEVNAHFRYNAHVCSFKLFSFILSNMHLFAGDDCGSSQ